MANGDEILSLVEQQEHEAAKMSRQAMIIQPGAIGDCVLTLPIADHLGRTLDLGTVAVMGNTDYTSYFVGRTCVNKIRAMEGAWLHRMFAPAGEFKLADGDSLLSVFAPYSWIVSFLGESGSAFEQNLVFAANCTHSAEVATLKQKPEAGQSGHICQYYMDQLAKEFPWIEAAKIDTGRTFINCTHNDKVKAEVLLEREGIAGPFVVIMPGSGAGTKCWPVENFAEAGRALKTAGYRCVFLAGPAELEREGTDYRHILTEIGPVVAEPELSEVCGLLSLCAGYLGNDTGVSHIAGAIGARALVLFGPTKSEIYRPLGPNVKTIQFATEEFGKVSEAGQDRVIKSVLEMLGG